jgi:hypothetical protein
MKLNDSIRLYFTHKIKWLLVFDCFKWAFIAFFFWFWFPKIIDFLIDPKKLYIFHRRLFVNPDYAFYKHIWQWTMRVGAFSILYFLLTTPRNWYASRVENPNLKKKKKSKPLDDSYKLPPYPFKPELFSLVLGELQSRNGKQLPVPDEPDLKARWLIQPLTGLFTGFLITGGIGSGKTSSAGLPILDQLIAMRREVPVIRNGVKTTELYQWSGLVTDEKGDFCDEAIKLCRKHGREADFIRIAPKGKVKWNCVYNPSLETWKCALNLSKIVGRVNKGQQGSDPFWEHSSKEFISDFLQIIDYAVGYYSITDYLKVMQNVELQDMMCRLAKDRNQGDPVRYQAAVGLANKIVARRKEYGQQLLSNIQASAKAGLTLFEVESIRATFSPSEDEYYTGACCVYPKPEVRLNVDLSNVPEEKREAILRNHDIAKEALARQLEYGIRLPQEGVFTGFDTILENGKIVGLDMPRSENLDATQLIQIALKASWQASVDKRDTRDAFGNLVVEPKFGKEINYCPTFIMADECQESVDTGDQRFMAQCRSKKACCIWLTQSYSSINAAMGSGKENDAKAFIANASTKLHFRQTDDFTLEAIEKEVGLMDVAKTSLSYSEGANDTKLNYVVGEFTNETINLSKSKSVQIEEKPRFDKEFIRTLPNFTCIALVSSGDTIMDSTVLYMRPPFLWKLFPDLPTNTSYFDWPDEIRKEINLKNIDQKPEWNGWNGVVVERTGDEMSLSGFLSGPLLGMDFNSQKGLEDQMDQEKAIMEKLVKAFDASEKEKRREELSQADATLAQAEEVTDGVDHSKLTFADEPTGDDSEKIEMQGVNNGRMLDNLEMLVNKMIDPEDPDEEEDEKAARGYFGAAAESGEAEPGEAGESNEEEGAEDGDESGEYDEGIEEEDEEDEEDDGVDLSKLSIRATPDGDDEVALGALAGVASDEEDEG